MSTTTGLRAEQVAAAFLVQQGYRVLAQNWKTQRCEIDIVAEKDGSLHFVEVKYREQSGQGSGLDYITKGKLKQMKFAAEIYAMEQKWNGAMNLAAIEVSGPDDRITNFIESISADF